MTARKPVGRRATDRPRPGPTDRKPTDRTGATTMRDTRGNTPAKGRVCPTCQRDMLNSPGCIPRPGSMTPIQDWEYLTAHPGWEDLEQPTWRCWDCGAMPDGFHHPYCSKTTCAICKDQRLTCLHCGE